MASLSPMKSHCAGEKPLSYGEKLWCDVPAAGSTLHSRLSRDTRARTTVLAFSLEEAQHASFQRARAVPGELWSGQVL